jgi:dihydroflavonol-4-reductase
VNDFTKGTDVVYHLAAQISVDGAMGGLVAQTNTEGTRNIVNACLTHEIKKLIHFSSIHALQDQPGKEAATITEDTALALSEGNLDYGRSKAQAEAVVIEGVAAGLNATILNPGGVLGPYDFKPSRMGEVLIQLQQKKMPALVEGGFAWVDVRDVVEAAIVSETNGRPGERYILAGEWASFRKLADTAHSVTGIKPPLITAPVWLAKLGVPFVSAASKILGTSPLYTLESICAIQCHRNLSYEKAKSELGFNPRPLSETLRDTYEWHQSQGQLC